MAVDESSSEQQFCKLVLLLLCEKSGAMLLVLVGPMAKILVDLEILYRLHCKIFMEFNKGAVLLSQL